MDYKELAHALWKSRCLTTCHLKTETQESRLVQFSSNPKVWEPEEMEGNISVWVWALRMGTCRSMSMPRLRQSGPKSRVVLSLPLCSTQTLHRSDHAHSHWGGQIVLFSLPVKSNFIWIYHHTHAQKWCLAKYSENGHVKLPITLHFPKDLLARIQAVRYTCTVRLFLC